MNWIKNLFKDDRRIGLMKGEYEQGGLVGKLQNYPVIEFTATIRENETKNGFVNIDIESTQNVDKKQFKRDLLPDGSWVKEEDITWII